MKPLFPIPTPAMAIPDAAAPAGTVALSFYDQSGGLYFFTLDSTVPDVVAYRLYRSGVQVAEIAPEDYPNISDETLTGGPALYKASAVTASDEIFSEEIGAPPLNAPADVDATVAVDNGDGTYQILVTWTDTNTLEEGYSVLAVIGGVETELAGEGQDASGSNVILPSGTYEIVIRAICNGVIADSEPFEITVP